MGQWGWTDPNREPDVSFSVSIDSRGFRSTGRSVSDGAVRIAFSPYHTKRDIATLRDALIALDKE